MRPARRASAWKASRAHCYFLSIWPQRIFGRFALGDINVDADEAFRASVAIVRDESACLDPPNLSTRANNAIIRFVLWQPLCESLAEKSVKARKIVWMHTGPPVVTPDFRSSFRKTMYRYAAC